jgi:hypothetical protein
MSNSYQRNSYNIFDQSERFAEASATIKLQCMHSLAKQLFPDKTNANSIIVRIYCKPSRAKTESLLSGLSLEGLHKARLFG